MSVTVDHFGMTANFDDSQAVVVKAVLNDYIEAVSQNALLDIRINELEANLRSKEVVMREMQDLIDASISHLDPDKC